MRSSAQKRFTAVGLDVARNSQASTTVFSRRAGAERLERQDRTVGGRDPDGRRAAHGQRTDRFVELRRVADQQRDEFARQTPLIDQLQHTVGAVNPFDCLWDRNAILLIGRRGRRCLS
jgi:hypothetical protein